MDEIGRLQQAVAITASRSFAFEASSACGFTLT
jgi:hypothetical protein